MQKKEEQHMFNVLAKPVECALVVDPEKLTEFLKHKSNQKMKERILRNAKRLEEQMEKSDDHK